MMTVGYGDISPINSTEKIYIIIVTVISCMQFGFTMNMIAQIFQELANQAAEFK